jgi:hypothetical protein
VLHAPPQMVALPEDRILLELSCVCFRCGFL